VINRERQRLRQCLSERDRMKDRHTGVKCVFFVEILNVETLRQIFLRKEVEVDENGERRKK